MLRALNKLFGGRSGVIETAPIARVLPLKDVEDEEIPRYPPFAKGLPVAPLDKILATQAELIEKVRNSLGFTVDDFNRLVLPVIQRYAAFVHLLPASESHHHRGAGGLFRHGLEVAFWAAQASESVIFSIEGTPRERRDNEPRWRLASCFSGLLHDVGKPLSDVSITDKDGSITWNPYSESLHDWAHRHEIDRYFIRWRDKRYKRHEKFSLLAVDRIIPAETREFLSKSGPSIMEAMLEAISGTSVNQPVTKLMLRADQESVSRDLRQSRLDVDEFSYGVPVERYVFDAIRRLVKTGKWKVNEPGAKVWHLNQGVFIAWKQLGDLYDLISHDKIPGIPRDPDTLADILIERGFAVPNTVQEKGERAYYRYWEVLPMMLQKAAGSVKILMLRLESNDLVFTTEPPAAVAAEVVGDVEDAEIEFVDPDEGDDDQEEDEAALNDDMLAVEREAEKALAGLGFGDAMEMLKSTSPETDEKPAQGGKAETTAAPKAESSKKGKAKLKKDTEEQTQKPEEKEDLSPQDIAKNAPPLANDNPLQALKDVGSGLGDIDFPFDAFNASADTNSTDATASENPDATALEQPSEQLKPDFVPQEQNSLQGDDFPMFGGSDEPPSWAIEPLPMLTDAPEQTTPTPEVSHMDKLNQQEKDAKTLLAEMLAGYGDASALLEQAIMPVLEGNTMLGEVLCLMKGQAVILYPEGARSLGAPSEVLSKLSHANAIVPDPIMPGRKVRDFSGVKAIVLAEQLSDAVVAAIKDAEASMGGYQDAFELVSPLGADAGKSKTVPKQQGQQGRKKPQQQQKTDVSSGKAAPAQKAKGKASLQPPKEKKADVAAVVEDQERKPVEEKQNVARLPKREVQPTAPEPKVGREKELGHVEVREREEQEVREFEPPKAKMNPKDINEKDFLPSGVTPQKALQMLKDMIQTRSGRWLVTPVLEEDGCLVTSDKAFDMIAGENIGISKHILCGMLSRAQRRPLLKKRQGKLYLEVDET
uniref:MobH family relaxase n=1 Tax=Photorhabdus sp. RM322S TaxID=3342825 RepID=UPI0036DEE3C5